MNIHRDLYEKICGCDTHLLGFVLLKKIKFFKNKIPDQCPPEANCFAMWHSVTYYTIVQSWEIFCSEEPSLTQTLNCFCLLFSI